MKNLQNILAFLGVFIVFCSWISFSQALQNFVPVGCFKDKLQDRALPDLIINHRISDPVIDWSNLSITVQSCAKAAQDKGYVYFALQFWGECWAGHSGHLTYDKHGPSTHCERGVGKGYTNFVYRNTGVDNECEAPRVLDSEDRAMTYSKKLAPFLCDEHMVPGWYRFKGKAGNAIANTCPAKWSCGTHMAGWMKGSHPQPSQGITDAKVCIHYPEQNNCCVGEEPIKVRNCGRFYVYKLKPAEIGCFSRYCGNGR
ncbi:pancreatic secretory granule membrane major glycoprotein GP2-like [Actinia tenebrosa]|uniref:Pancreatic secretory granule membrane major glycoprotein GP2-like n=1 Tax=Actinia tenebrosa TaxID=6105 RepID=A0A6P8IFQ9_ACTTE|nr:pancreatic secretory granule membrane major glycoprotein GP2-like [Actinia tenebrosa]